MGGKRRELSQPLSILFLIAFSRENSESIKLGLRFLIFCASLNLFIYLIGAALGALNEAFHQLSLLQNKQNRSKNAGYLNKLTDFSMNQNQFLRYDVQLCCCHYASQRKHSMLQYVQHTPSLCHLHLVSPEGPIQDHYISAGNSAQEI